MGSRPAGRRGSDARRCADGDRRALRRRLLTAARLDEAARGSSTLRASRATCRPSGSRSCSSSSSGSSPDESSADALILPAVLATRRADPLVISMLGHEIARRAGLESHVCIAGGDSWTALLDAENCTLIGASPLVRAATPRERVPRRLRARDGVVLLERLARPRSGARGSAPPRSLPRCAAGARRPGGRAAGRTGQAAAASLSPVDGGRTADLDGRSASRSGVGCTSAAWSRRANASVT